jgi:hypothetical protein
MHSIAARFLSQTWCDVEQHVGLPVALLGLMRLEQEHARRADHGLAGVVAVRLGDDARFLGHLRGQGMIEVVGVGQRVGEDEGGMGLAVDVDQAEELLLRYPHGVVAHVEELHLRHARAPRRALRLLAPRRFDSLERDALLAPQLLRLAALAEGEADDVHGVASAAWSAMAPAARQTKSAEWALTTRAVFQCRSTPVYPHP